jgi:transcription-repair coupling factor (superfamily II helicase)
VIEFSTQHRVDPARVIKLIQTQPNRYRLEGAHKIRLTHKAETPASRIALAEEYLKYFVHP